MNIYNYVHSKMKIIIMEEKMVQCPFFVYYLSFLIFFLDIISVYKHNEKRNN